MTTTNRNPHLSLTKKVEPLVVKSLKKFAPDEVVTFGIGLMAYPDPSAPALSNGDSTDSSGMYAYIPALVLYLEIPGAAETFVYSSPILPPFGANQANVDAAVEDTLNSLRKSRDEQALTADSPEV